VLLQVDQAFRVKHTLSGLGMAKVYGGKDYLEGGEEMKTYFDDDGSLCIDAENNTEMVALKTWLENTNRSPKICATAHLNAGNQGQPTQGENHE